MTPKTWFCRFTIISSWLVLSTTIALPACDSSSSKDDTDEADDDDASKKEKAKKKKKKKKKGPTDELADFIKDFQGDGPGMGKYDMKEVSLTGYVIGSKSMGTLGSFFIATKRDDTSLPYVGCLMVAKEGEELDPPNKGELVTLKGKVVTYNAAQDDGDRFSVTLQAGCTWTVVDEKKKT